ncbi:sensor histidine kinase [Zavarzinia compransoris]|uniref:histidine kinase n=1 Tax=Zavarzinia compransoris TaxID=1264899 RepID=A0A317EA61_9PROT|nr:hypothetical protein [Zavarzinia compransoris]PWR24007.1 hypothetical protein DKG75_05550 [Zavarzinia compransoris]TDP48267.1 signal transduction histidine kinase [Zavarzinia compransoris]
MKSLSRGARQGEPAASSIDIAPVEGSASAREPATLMLWVVALCIAAVVGTMWSVLAQPWLGLHLGVAADGRVTVIAAAAGGPGSAVPAGSVLHGLSVPGGPVLALEAQDLTPEPDFITSYADLDRFMARQSALHAILGAGQVVLHYAGADGAPLALAVVPGERPLADLPVDFWVQFVTGIGSLLISGWVWSIRPRDWPPRFFIVSGVAMVMSAHAAAIYSSRELALDGILFQWLSAANFLGAMGFGAAAVALFLRYPMPLAATRHLVWLTLFVAVCFAADRLRLFDGQTTARYLPTATEMVSIVLAVAAQWLATRRDAAARAALNWLGLTISIGAGCFILIIGAPLLIGREPYMSQGYAFGFFLLIYLGVALGLRRYRLFAIGEWSFRVLFYGGAILTMLVLDAALLYVLHLGPEPSLGLALVFVGFLYLPLRDALWRRTVARRRMAEPELFRAVIEVAFGASAEERAGRWRALLERLFDPLEIAPLAEPPRIAQLRGDGTEMRLPPTGETGGLALRYPFGGRALFSLLHLNLARQLGLLMQHAEASRSAYERGVAEERRRISRDLHDDVGARLLSGLHKGDIGDMRKILREAIVDIRSIAGALAGDRLPLSVVAADLRHETFQRLDGTGIALDWPMNPAAGEEVMVDYTLYRHFVSAAREIVSNAIRHSGASRLDIRLAWGGGLLRAAFADNGIGRAEAALGGIGRAGAAPGGNGLRNLTARVGAVGGTIAFPPVAAGFAIEITLPLGRTAS